MTALDQSVMQAVGHGRAPLSWFAGLRTFLSQVSCARTSTGPTWVWTLAVHIMANPFQRELGLIAAWLIFPLVPVVLADLFCGNGADPRDWGWDTWLIELGPLLGFAFLAGATLDLPDGPWPAQRRWRQIFSRRTVWVAVGPWCGGLILLAGLVAYGWVGQFVTLPRLPVPEFLEGTRTGSILSWLVVPLFFGIWSYGWIWPAWLALRRAARMSRFRRTFYKGVSVAVAFVSSLFGSFWAATAFWRDYFFDPRIVPLLVVALGLLVASGCSNTLTYGEVRRRELFHAMLVAWVLGLALMWRWWSRNRGEPPQES